MKCKLGAVTIAILKTHVTLIDKSAPTKCAWLQSLSWIVVSIFKIFHSWFTEIEIDTFDIIKERSLILPVCHSELIHFFDLRIRESKKKLESVGNQNYTETHLTAMSIDQKDNSFVGFVQNDTLFSYKSRVMW